MLRALIHHWRIQLAVALGAAVAAAILAGALVVGDSVRGSLRDLTLDRLGAIDHALVAPRFFREALAAELDAVPLVVLRGSARHSGSGARASGIGLYGVEVHFAELYGTALDLTPQAGQLFPSVIVNESLARELGARVGDALLLDFERYSEIPRESLIGEKEPEKVLGTLRVTLTAIVADRGPGRFGLRPTQEIPQNAFVALPELARATGERDRVNALLVAGPDPGPALRRAVTLEDMGLVLTRREDHVVLESRELVLAPAIDRLLGEVAGELAMPLLRTQAYLANEIRAGERSIPYSMVAALDPRPAPAWAVLPLVSGSAAKVPRPDGILLNRWAADELAAKPGDRVSLTYYVVGAREELSEAQTTFEVEGIVALEGLGAARTLTPDYPGIREAQDIAAWDPPFPVDLKRIRPADEAYWDEHGPTPKAFVAEATGRRLWSTRFGSTTAVRLGPVAGESVEHAEVRLRAALARRLDPAAFGLAFRPVKAEGLAAAAGSTDFSGLFLSFSMFLIVSAALLIGLLFRLGVERRAGEIGLLLAVGHRVAQVRRGLLAEGAVLAAAGGLVGLSGALGFAALMMAGLRTIWRPAVGSSELFLHVSPVSLVAGFSGTLVVVLASVFFAVRRLVRVPPARLLAGTTVPPARTRAGRTSRVLLWGGLSAAAALLLFAPRESPGVAFGAGALLLAAGLAGFARWCRARRRAPVAPSLMGLAVRNGAWNPPRSLLSVALVATSCFMIVVVEVFRVDPGSELERKDSGSGGYALIAQSDVALHQDLNDEQARSELGFSDELRDVRIVPLRRLAGDDASCNNLYRPERPTLLGLPQAFVERGGFRFRGDGSWRLLEETLDDGAVPAIADANSAQWILKVGLGEEITLDDEQGNPLRLKLVGLLERSLFQSELLIAEDRLLEHFPSVSGDERFLIDAPPERTGDVAHALESTLSRFGFDVTPVRERLARYEAVQNTYLSTFQVLGGLGLLLGTVGLGVVLVRSVIERRGELAAMRAFGFRRAQLARLVLGENLFLLLFGIGLGSAAALAAAAPSLAGRPVAWLSLLAALALVVATGLLASVAAVRSALGIPLLPALKAER